MSVVKRIEPLSAMKIGGILYGILGLLVGAIFSVLALSGVFSSPLAGSGMPGRLPVVFGAPCALICTPPSRAFGAGFGTGTFCADEGIARPASDADINSANP